MNFRCLIYLLLGGAIVWPGRGVEPPLPGEDGPRPARQAFQPLLQPGDSLPPGSEAEVLPDDAAVMPPELFPEGSMPAGPADGAQAPSVPFDPGLIRPEDLMRPGGVPRGSMEPPPLLPPARVPSIPDMEMAARAYWHKSPREAREAAKRERKPLMLWFYTRRKSAPMGVYGDAGAGDQNLAINDDLLSTPEFQEWAASHIVLTSLFYPSNPPRDFPEDKKAALQQFKDYFKVKGFPCLILLDENGREIERVKGYRRVKNSEGDELSSATPILEQLKTAVSRREAVIAAADEKLARLEAQNFRVWTSQAGSTLMAKLVSATGDAVVLMSDEGAPFRVAPDQLSIIDRAWIRRQQKGSAWKVGELRMPASGESP